MWKAQSRTLLLQGRECTLSFSLATWRDFETGTGVSLARSVEPRYLVRLLATMLGDPDQGVKFVGGLPLKDSKILMAAAADVLRINVHVEHDQRSSEPGKLLDPMDWLDTTAMAWFDLRVTPEQFEVMRPAFFYALIRRFDEANERFFMASSIISSILVNIHSDPSKHEAISPLVFSPTKLGQQARAEMEQDKKKAIRAKILGLANIIPGAVVGEAGLALLQAAQKKG